MAICFSDAKSSRLCECGQYECYCGGSHMSIPVSDPQHYSTSPESFTNYTQPSNKNNQQPQASPAFPHYYSRRQDDNASKELSQPPMYLTNHHQSQWSPSDNTGLVPHPNYSTIHYNSQLSPGRNTATTIFHHQEFYQQQNYHHHHHHSQQHPIAEQFSPSCMYPSYYYNSCGRAERSSDSVKSEVTSINTPLNIGCPEDGQDCMKTTSESSPSSVSSMIMATGPGSTNNSCEVSPQKHHHHQHMGNSRLPPLYPLQIQDTKQPIPLPSSDRICHTSFISQISPALSSYTYDVKKLQPIASSNSISSQQEEPQHSGHVAHTGSYTTDADSQEQLTSGLQLPAIASIIDSCDNNNGHPQINTFQNTTIINHRNLIVYCK